LQPGEQAPVAAELRPMARGDFKIAFEHGGPNQGPTVTAGFQRLVQYLRGIQFGLALGGGAARGMAHVGVLKAMDASGIAGDQLQGELREFGVIMTDEWLENAGDTGRTVVDAFRAMQ